jgi:hypothetical protein
MSGPWFLIGTAIGLAAVIAWGRRIYLAQYKRELTRQPWPLESDGIDIPAWVNQGNRAVIGQYEEILAAIHEAAHIELWENELRGVQDS